MAHPKFRSAPASAMALVAACGLALFPCARTHAQNSSVLQASQVAAGGETRPASPSLQPGALTIETWIATPSAVTNSPAFVAYGPDNNPSYTLRAPTIDGSSSVEFSFITGTGTTRILRGRTLLQPGAEYHLAVTYNGSSARLYVNGVLERSLSASGALYYSGSAGLGLGRKYGSLTNAFSGTQRGVGIYGSALSASQISAHFAAGPPSPVFQLDQVASGGETRSGSPALEPSSAITVAAWINASSAQTNYPAFVSYGVDASVPYESYILQAAAINGTRPADFYFLTDSGTSHMVKGSTALQPETTYFVVATYDGSWARIYVNGIRERSLAVSGPLYYYGGGLGLGMKYALARNTFSGTVRSVSIHGTALSADRIMAMYQAGPEPSVPTSFNAATASPTQINLTWAASADDAGVTGYLLERCDGANCTHFVQVAAPSGTTYNDTGLTPASTYTYRVRAVNAKNTLSEYSNSSMAVTQGGGDTQAPSAPAGLTATASSSTQIGLSWSASTDDVAVAGYLLERCQGASCSNFTQIAAPGGTTYNDAGLAASTTYRYRVRAKDAASNLSSYSNTASATTASGAVAPSITTQPANQSVSEGQTATFAVTASGTAPLGYQWRRGSTNISGATSASYTTPATQASDNGATFSVVVSNSAGSVTSNIATLTVAAKVVPPTITTQPSNQTVTMGATATFAVSASGSSPLSYQWKKGGSNISGATSASYQTPPTTGSDNGAMFSVVVSNSAGNVTSNGAMLSVIAPPSGSADVLTYKYNNARTGQNTAETLLTPANVNSTKFGLLRKFVVNGKVNAQPLYVHQLTVNGAPHNVVFVATEHATVYAFDADTGATLWQRSMIPSGEVVADPHWCDQVVPEVGLTATPVIDRNAGAHGALYLVAQTMSDEWTYIHRLHALDITTGADITTPTVINASYSAAGGSSELETSQHYVRAALLLNNGAIYTAWTSHCDAGPFNGWVIAFNQTTLAQTGAIDLAVNSGGAGPAIWMAGGGPAADSAGNVYLITGNGRFETSLSSGFPSRRDFGNSFVKLGPSAGTLSVVDYFTMWDVTDQSSSDLDFGSGGAMLLPDLTDSAGTVRHLAVGAGKDGNIYVVNRDSMGHYNASSNNIWQQLTGVMPGGVFSTPAYFNNTVYYGEKSGSIKAFRIANAKLSTSPVAQTATTFRYPGTSPVVSANGTSNAIVWAHENATNAVLHAYDATDLHELYNSEQAANGRDRFGAGNKFIAPAVVDGKVFIGSQNAVGVFGLLP
jgi:chitodextrinase